MYCHEIILDSEAGRKAPLNKEIFEFHICLINILQLQGLCPLDQKLSIQWRHDPRPYALAQNPAHAMTV